MLPFLAKSSLIFLTFFFRADIQLTYSVALFENRDKNNSMILVLHLFRI